MKTKLLFLAVIVCLNHHITFSATQETTVTEDPFVTRIKNMKPVMPIQMAIQGLANAIAQSQGADPLPEAVQTKQDQLDALFEASGENILIQKALENIVAENPGLGFNKGSQFIQDRYGARILQRKLQKNPDAFKALTAQEEKIIEDATGKNIANISNTETMVALDEQGLEEEITQSVENISAREIELAKEQSPAKIKMLKEKISRSVKRIASSISNASESIKANIKGWFFKQTLKYKVTKPIVDNINAEIKFNESLKKQFDQQTIENKLQKENPLLDAPFNKDNIKKIQNKLAELTKQIADLSKILIDDALLNKTDYDKAQLVKKNITKVQQTMKTMFDRIYTATDAGSVTGAEKGMLAKIQETFIEPAQKVISTVFDFNPQTKALVSSNQTINQEINSYKKISSTPELWDKFITREVESNRQTRPRAGTTAAGLGKPLPTDDEDTADDTFTDENNLDTTVDQNSTKIEPVVTTEKTPDAKYQNLTPAELDGLILKNGITTIKRYELPTEDLIKEYDKAVAKEKAEVEKQKREAAAVQADPSKGNEQLRRPFGDGQKSRGLSDALKAPVDRADIVRPRRPI